MVRPHRSGASLDHCVGDGAAFGGVTHPDNHDDTDDEVTVDVVHEWPAFEMDDGEPTVSHQQIACHACGHGRAVTSATRTDWMRHLVGASGQSTVPKVSSPSKV